MIYAKLAQIPNEKLAAGSRRQRIRSLLAEKPGVYQDEDRGEESRRHEPADRIDGGRHVHILLQCVTRWYNVMDLAYPTKRDGERF
jgi:hypothetical protein